MLIAKGYEVAFKMKAGSRVVRAPKAYAMLHDPGGASWPKTSVLVAPFRRLGSSSPPSGDASSYFGYDPRRGELELPPKGLSAWREVGEVAEIDYWRTGTHEGEYFHRFKGGGWLFSSSQPLPLLYRRGRLMRLELGQGAVLNWRGFVYP